MHALLWPAQTRTPLGYTTTGQGTPRIWSESDYEPEHLSDSDGCDSDVDLIMARPGLICQRNIEPVGQKGCTQTRSPTGPPDSIYVSEPYAADLKYQTETSTADTAPGIAWSTTLLGLRSRLLRVEAKARFTESHDVDAVSCQNLAECDSEDMMYAAFENDQLMEMGGKYTAASATRTPPPWKRARTL